MSHSKYLTLISRGCVSSNDSKIVDLKINLPGKFLKVKHLFYASTEDLSKSQFSSTHILGMKAKIFEEWDLEKYCSMEYK